MILKLNFKIAKKINSKLKGFTLIELLIVIAVIGGLAAVAVSTFPASSRRAKDATRKSDIKQFQTAMEIYYNRQNVYPVSSGTPTSGGVCGSANLDLPACPTDPKTGWNYSLYSTTTSYVISAQLEQPNDPAKNYFVVCSDGRSGDCANPGTASACGGSCP